MLQLAYICTCPTRDFYTPRKPSSPHEHPDCSSEIIVDRIHPKYVKYQYPIETGQPNTFRRYVYPIEADFRVRVVNLPVVQSRKSISLLYAYICVPASR